MQGRAGQQTLAEKKENKDKQDIAACKMPEGQTDTTAMEATFLRLVKDLRDGADMYITQTKKLTTSAILRSEHKAGRCGG